MRRGLFTLGSVCLAAGFASSAGAATIPASAVMASLEANRGDGLMGNYYDPGPRMTSLADAEAYVGANAPDATFTSTRVDYPNGAVNSGANVTGLATYLGVDGTTLGGAPASHLDGSIFVFSGFLAISSDMDTDTADPDIDVGFAVGSDDGFRLTIGGTTVAAHPGERGFGFSYGDASFEAEGLYAIELLYYEDQSFTGVEWHSTIDGGPADGAPLGYEGIVPTSALSTTPVPLPGAAWLLGSGLLALFGAGRLQQGEPMR